MPSSNHARCETMTFFFSSNLPSRDAGRRKGRGEGLGARSGVDIQNFMFGKETELSIFIEATTGNDTIFATSFMHSPYPISAYLASQPTFFSPDSSFHLLHHHEAPQSCPDPVLDSLAVSPCPQCHLPFLLLDVLHTVSAAPDVGSLAASLSASDSSLSSTMALYRLPTRPCSSDIPQPSMKPTL